MALDDKLKRAWAALDPPAVAVYDGDYDRACSERDALRAALAGLLPEVDLLRDEVQVARATAAAVRHRVASVLDTPDTEFESYNKRLAAIRNALGPELKENSVARAELVAEVLRVGRTLENVPAGPWDADTMGNYVWAPCLPREGGRPREEDEKFRVLEARGWGHLTGRGAGGCAMPDARAGDIQDAVVKFAASARQSVPRLLRILSALLTVEEVGKK